jgi:hypothetical protein
MQTPGVGFGSGSGNVYIYNGVMDTLAKVKSQQIKMQSVADDPNADPIAKRCSIEGLEAAKKLLPVVEAQGRAEAQALGINAGDYGKMFTYEEYQARYHATDKKDENDPNDLTAIVAKILQAKGEAESAKGSHINTSA